MSHPESAKVQKLITPEAVCQTLLEMVDIRSPTRSEAGMADFIVNRMRSVSIDALAASDIV